ncbi:MAG: response regulator [Candidatus Zixiibacteriota bacterium]|nr:MAG: response regulator [candidate division Zixibacteria bacterium]
MMQRILVVDDEPHMLKLMERIITEKTPFYVECTSNALEVPAILDRKTFDLVITDLKMPGMDGMDILKLINDNQRWEKVVMMTAFGSLEKALEALSTGVFDYITKPFKKEQIIFTINKAMRWQSIKREMRQLSQIFDREPYTDAVLAFKHEYIRRLASRLGGDYRVLTEHSGLSGEEIAVALEEWEPDQD